MRDYLKILSSIIAALLSLALLASATTGVNALVSNNHNILRDVLWPFLFVWAGFVMFGIIGSVFWFGFLRMLSKLISGPMKRQTLAASLSIVATLLTISLALSRWDFEVLLEAAFFLVFIVPVVAVSLLWYWFLYLRPKLKANHGDG